MATLTHALVAALLATAASAVWLWHVHRHPWMPCGKCHGSGSARHLSLAPFGHCSRCGGKGKRLRVGARLSGYDLDSGRKRR